MGWARLRYSTALALTSLCVGLGPAAADIRVDVSGDTIVVQAKNATVPEILSALESALHVKIKLTGSATQLITGSYSGPPRRVLSRLLDGVNYIINSGPDGISIAIVDANAPRPALRIAAATTTTVAADAEGSTAQGWNPAVVAPLLATTPKIATAQGRPASAPATPGPAVQDTSAPPAAASPAADGDSEPQAQGWNGSPGSFIPDRH